MVNSVALEGDGCNICSEAEAELMDISHRLNCSREVGDDLKGTGAFSSGVSWGHGEWSTLCFVLLSAPSPLPSMHLILGLPGPLTDF